MKATKNKTVIAALLTIASCSLLPTTLLAGQRPITDFTSQQSFPFSGVEWFDPNTGFILRIDLLGQFDQVFFGGALGTTVDGSISEASLPDGRAEVQVILHTSKALVRAFEFDPSIDDLVTIFGYNTAEVLGGAPPTLADSVFQLRFKNTKPGAPLPDLAQLISAPEPGQELEVLSIRARASGPLRAAFGVPEGTPGRLEMTQTGLIATALKANPNSRVALDAYPAEHIDIKPVGN
jgi:hypothetical protein